MNPLDNHSMVRRAVTAVDRDNLVSPITADRKIGSGKAAAKSLTAAVRAAESARDDSRSAASNAKCAAESAAFLLKQAETMLRDSDHLCSRAIFASVTVIVLSIIINLIF